MTIDDILNDNLNNRHSIVNADICLFLKRALEAVVCMEEYNKIYFEFVFEILQKEDGVLSHLLNLACYTLLKANVMVKDVFSCAEAVYLSKEQIVVMDPTNEEREKAQNFALMCKMKESNEVCAFKMQGLSDNKTIEEMMSYLFASCNSISQIIVNQK